MDSRAANSPLLGGINTVEVTFAASHKTLHIHDVVVDAVPFLQVQKKRWVDGNGRPLRIDLPAGLSLDALILVFDRIYYPGKHICVHFEMALQLVQVASMLDCADEILNCFVSVVQSSVSSEEDVVKLCELCEARQICESLAKIAKRLKQAERDIMDRETLQTMLVRGAQANQADMMRIAEQHLRKKSRRGGSTRDEVASILADVHTRSLWHSNYLNSSNNDHFGDEKLISLAADFVETHAHYYERIIKAVFTDKTLHVRCDSNDAVLSARSLIAKWFQRFVAIGIKHLKAEALDHDGLASLYALAVVQTIEVVRHAREPLLVEEECLKILVSALSQMDGDAQLKVCSVLAAKSDASTFAHLVREDLLATLFCEAKAAFIDKLMSSLADSLLRKVLTVPILDHFGNKAKLALSAKADGFTSEVRSALLEFAALSSDDSDEGF